ncbi:hypothetical protein HGRIS_000069 [Hohenbuehelia grisea]|uniref:Uncharacterized protein n=1 Tax=Hohenbuehelia grisea TaxID=104357 RepID=A0ABR3JPZ2_9AGAR
MTNPVPLIRSMVLNAPGSAKFEGITVKIVKDLDAAMISAAHYSFLPKTPAEDCSMTISSTINGFNILVSAPNFKPDRDHFSWSSIHNDDLGLCLDIYGPRPSFFKASFTFSGELSEQGFTRSIQWRATEHAWRISLIKKSPVRCFRL